MSNAAKISAECLTPILYVRDLAEAMNYYTEKLLFDRLWEWGDPPDFGAVRLGKVEIFFCLGGQGHPETWLSIFVDDVDEKGSMGSITTLTRAIGLSNRPLRVDRQAGRQILTLPRRNQAGNRLAEPMPIYYPARMKPVHPNL
jgi:hypothetical protein